ncbi:MAG: DNA repair exonuclease [Candidatus Woesearchaeota archaeon]|nr:DNA repair exonuclease [Candidatus Woesearchaeota archaeon]
MRFAHMADCHIGAWREPKLRDANMQAFFRAVEICIEKRVDFVLIAGDLFNTAFPSIDSLKDTVLKLRELKDKKIPVYIIPGSHDYSPSGKTMLDVLENAKLFTNVFRGSVSDGKLSLSFTRDEKTGAKITGILGKRGMLEKSYYENLEREPLEKESGFKIFMFHSPIQELSGADSHFESAPISFLPKGFNYYAGGHVHTVLEKDFSGYGKIVYPGPIFPNSFSEVEELQNGGFFIVDADENSLKAEYEPIVAYNTCPISIECTGKSAEEVTTSIIDAGEKREFINTIVLIRLSGKLSTGKISDINFTEIFSYFYGKGAFFVMKNTFSLKSDEFTEVMISSDSVEKIEEAMIEENSSQMNLSGCSREEIKGILHELIKALSAEKREGERQADFEARLKSDAEKALNIN